MSGSGASGEHSLSRRGQPLLDDRHDSLSEDVFGHGDYAHMLAEALKLAPDGLTIGLFGEWGIGKSSVLHALSTATPTTTAVVVFDAWRYGEDAFRREFLRHVAERLVAQKALGRFDIQRDLADLDIDTASPQEFLRIGRARAAVFGLSIAVLILAWLAVNGNLVDTDAAGKVGLVTIVGVVALVIGRLETLAKVQTRTETHRQLEDADRFARRFRELLAAVKAQHLVIAVDNIDRLEPDAAMDVLSTIKTYLEPAVDRPAPTAWQRLRRHTLAPTKVNFVVAVDADALVAHLHADRQGPPDARPPDDFLRKFFAARITMRALLDDDLEPFVRRRVEPLVDAWTPHVSDLPDDTSVADWRTAQIASVTELIVAGVRRNPRRLKQFINSIQMAMLLLELRYQRDQLRDRPTELDVVAQLVFIEEDCPQTFRRLVANPDLLDELHRAAQGAASPPIGDQDEWQRLVPVLRSTYSADRSGARTYLRLKVPDTEQQLPDYDAIRAALRAGDANEVEGRLDPMTHMVLADRTQEPTVLFRQVPQSQSAALWAAHLPEFVRREMAAGRTDVVVNVLRCLLDIDVLFAYADSASATIGRAMTDPEIRAAAWRLPSDRLLEVVDRLEPHQRQATFDALGRWYSSPIDATPDRLDALARGFAERGVPLSDQVRAGLRESLAAQPRLGQLDYTPIVRAAPEIFPDVAIEPFLGLVAETLKAPLAVRASGRSTTIERDHGVQAVRGLLDGPRQVVIDALAGAGRLPLDRRLGELLTTMLDKSQWDDAVRDRVLAAIGSLVHSAPSVDDAVIDGLTNSTRIYISLSQYASPTALLALAACLSRHHSPTTHRREVQEVLTHIGLLRLTSTVKDADALLVGPLRAWLLDHVNGQAAQSPADRADLVARLDPNALIADAAPDVIAEAFREWGDEPDNQDQLIIAVGSAGFDDRAAVEVEGVGLISVSRLEPRPDDLDHFDATLSVAVEAQISPEPEDVEPGASGQSSVDLDVSATIRLRRDPRDPEEISVTLVDVVL